MRRARRAPKQARDRRPTTVEARDPLGPQANHRTPEAVEESPLTRALKAAAEDAAHHAVAKHDPPIPQRARHVETPPEKMKSSALPWGFAGLSLSVHLVLVLLVPPAVAPTSVRARPTAELPVRLVPGEGPATTGGSVPDTEASRLTPGGAHALDQNVDAPDPGVGGDGWGAIEVVLLVPHEDAITLTDAPWNAIGPSQTSRIDVADDRATFEDRRATPHPSDTPFVASGPGEHAERRPVATLDAREGARIAPSPSTAGMRTDAREGVGDGSTETHVGALDRERTGAESDSPGVGIVGGEGARSSEAARVATGRPAVDPGTASTTAETRDRTRDDTDAELLASRLLESFVESSRRAGAREGEGVGGRDTPGAPGSGGGREAGGHARALGTGDGGFEALDTSDARYRRWLLDEQRRLDRAMVFPRARALAMDQGTSVFRVTLRRDGSMVGSPRLIRSSGFSDLDAAARVAIESGSFAPLPEEIAPGSERVTITLPLEWSNPMVR